MAFNEQQYLASNPDVARAVKGGQFASGLDHYNKYGMKENRTFSAPVPQAPRIDGAGVLPTTIEPFNKTQKDALTGMSKGLGAVSTKPTEMYGAAAEGYKAAGNRTYDPSGASKYFNPYEDQVVEASLGDVRKQHGVIDRDIRERTARIGGYGSTAQGMRQGENDAGLTREVGRIGSTLRYQGYNDALDRDMGQFNNESAQKLASLAGLTGLGDKYLNYDQYARGAKAGDFAMQYGAGETIQNQNQKTLDAIESERLREQAYPYSQIDFLASILGKYPTGSTTTTSGASAPLWQSILGGAMLGNSVGKTLGGAAAK